MVLSVGVFRKREREEEKFLFIRRPAGGLLQNQWEFPTAILGQGQEQNTCAQRINKTTTELIDTSLLTLWAPFPELLRKQANYLWTTTLEQQEVHGETGETPVIRIGPSPTGNGTEILLESQPIVHTFSHQRHNMHIHITDVVVLYTGDDKVMPTTTTERVRWMSSKEIREAGITTGCRKVLDAVLASSAEPERKKQKLTFGNRKTTSFTK
jgi:adenine-specific DNA glycosylase